jgi:ADP-ribose pyrophosphatase YjhB (NUDIX family)
MSSFVGDNAEIHNIARGLLRQGDDIILCHTEDAGWYFLPGGHTENGESAKLSLKRELQEELVDPTSSVGEFVGVCENVFATDEGKQHEINIIFQVAIDNQTEIRSAEDHIEFIRAPENNLGQYNVLPTQLHEGVAEWLDTNKCFFKELESNSA